jgi:hypothetical protein
MHAQLINKDVSVATTPNTYEVQGFSADEWRVLSVCANSAAAMNEVAEARRSGKYLGIRVTVECFDKIARKRFSRVVYHYSPLSETRKPAPKATHALLGDGVRQARAAKATASDFTAHSYLDWMLATRLAVATGVAVVAVMAISFH